MSSLSRLLVVFVVGLIVIAMPGVPAQAQCGEPFIEFSRSSGVPGTEVTVYGHYFTEGVLVDIYYDGNRIATDRISSKGDFTVMITIPEGCQGHHQVFVKGKYASVDTYFTVKPGLTVNPAKGPVGTNVTVKGQGFANNEEGIRLMYYLNDNYQTMERRIIADAQGSWQTSFQIPPSTWGEHKIDADGAVSRLYEVKEAIFTVTAEISLDKSSGIAGDTITVTGSRFAAYEKGINILFEGEVVVTGIKANSKGEWEASFTVPDMAAGTYSVTAEGEQAKKEELSELRFEIRPGIVLSPDEGHVGTDLIITGQGFAAKEDVVIMYDGSQVATTQTNDKGSFEANFAVPQSQHGERLVTAEYAGENHASTIFTMESESPPIPALLSPAKGSRIGFMSKVTPTFEWSEVFDDSGVHYSLQIANSIDFTNPIIVKQGLVGTNYTLNAKEALPLGTYYWIVQAVDGAENESGWTTACSCRVGLLPLWGFIVAIFTIVVLIGVLVRYLVRRRIYYYE